MIFQLVTKFDISMRIRAEDRKGLDYSSFRYRLRLGWASLEDLVKSRKKFLLLNRLNGNQFSYLLKIKKGTEALRDNVIIIIRVAREDYDLQRRVTLMYLL